MEATTNRRVAQFFELGAVFRAWCQENTFARIAVHKARVDTGCVSLIRNAWTGSVSDFGFFRILQYLRITVRQPGDGGQI
jgi:hypothetical protein